MKIACGHPCAGEPLQSNSVTDSFPKHFLFSGHLIIFAFQNKIKIMTKNELIDLGKTFMEGKGFTFLDYIVSLQGPTFIFTVEGTKKLKPEDRKSLSQMGIKVLA
jgi:hypothetical protein